MTETDTISRKRLKKDHYNDGIKETREQTLTFQIRKHANLSILFEKAGCPSVQNTCFTLNFTTQEKIRIASPITAKSQVLKLSSHARCAMPIDVLLYNTTEGQLVFSFQYLLNTCIMDPNTKKSSLTISS